MHDKRIAHRSLSLDAVQVRMKDENMSLMLGSFDIALQLKSQGATAVTEKIASRRPLAPELQYGTSSDLAVDVWALGQIGYQLMCCP